jgi:hypothetical protein
METDPVIQSVLRVIAENQRDQHAENKKLLERIGEDVSEIKIDFAIMTRDVNEIKEWRRLTVDPFIASARDLTSQAKGGSKVLRWLYGAVLLVGGAWVYKFLAAVLPGIFAAAK